MLRKCKSRGTSKLDLIPLRYSRLFKNPCPLRKTLFSVGRVVGYVFRCPLPLRVGRSSLKEREIN